VNHAGVLALSRDELVALILAQHAQIEAQVEPISVLTARIVGLEAKLATPPRTPHNSSLPPSKGQKANLPDSGEKSPWRGRPGMARALSELPEKISPATLTVCPHCNHALGPADQSEIHANNHIDLVPAHLLVTRIHRDRGVCAWCRKHVAAPGPGPGPGRA
jgi:transposase